MSNWLNISGITIQSVDHIPPFHSNTRKTFSKSRALSIVSIQWKIYEPQYGDKDLLAPILLEIRHHHRCHLFKCFLRKDRYEGNFFCSNYRYHKVQYKSLCIHFKVSTFETRPIKYWSELFKNILLYSPIRVSIVSEQMPQWIYIKITFQPSGHNLEINLLKYYIKIKV